MDRKRKMTARERLEKQKIARRRRYADIKSDPILYELEKEKERKRYYKRKEERQIKSVNDESPRDQREIRKKWREASKKYRQRKKEQLNRTPEISEVVMIEAPDKDELELKTDPLDKIKSPDRTDTKIRRIRYIEHKKRKSLLQIIKQLQKQNKELKRRLSQDLVKKKVEVKDKTTPKVIFKENKKENTKLKHLVNLVREFYLEDINSTMAAGKKEYITKFKIQKQKRYMNYTQKMLHQKFMKRYQLKVSYTFFCKYRPFWVLTPTKSQRDTCKCIIHENIDLTLEPLKKAFIIEEANSRDLLKNLCCSMYESNCLKRECDFCKNRVIQVKEFSNDQEIISYKRIQRMRQILKTKKGQKVGTIVKKVEMVTTPRKLISDLFENLPAFFEHNYKIHTQYVSMKRLKDSMSVNCAIIHVDFSENYGLKFHKEVQSMHFGGSRKEVCLHTAVVYTFDFSISAIKPVSVCTTSSCLRHDAPAVWAHMVPLIKKTIDINPFIDTVHIQSDSPTSQYRNKYIFYMITQIYKDFPQLRAITWNYSEAGHGKGAPDGVGATVKRTVDSCVNHGVDVGTYEKFLQVVRQNTENITIIDVPEVEIDDKEKRIPDNCQTFRGTLAVHQVLWQKESENLTFRTASCFECSYGIVCAHGNHLGFLKIPKSHTTPTAFEDESVVTPLAATKNKENLILTNITNTNTVSVAGPSNIQILANKKIRMINL